MRTLFYAIMVMMLANGCGNNQQTKNPAPMQKPATAQAAAAGNTGSSASAEKKLAEGVALLNQGLVPAGLQAFDQAIKADPDDPRGYIALGEAYLRLNQLDPAISTFEQILKFSPENPEAYYLIGMAHGLKGDRNAAAQFAQQSLQHAQSQQNEEMFIKSAAMLKSLADAQQAISGN